MSDVYYEYREPSPAGYLGLTEAEALTHSCPEVVQRRLISDWEPMPPCKTRKKKSQWKEKK